MSETPEELLAILSSESSHLPNKTLFQLAMAGLRVRITRSLVTLISVILAIAYLTYSGVSSALIRALAGSDAEAVLTLLRQANINPDQVRLGNPVDRWLVVMALLTCTVGIANAMLMSVTERFREIGTMKCLGAEDSTVVKLFLIESSLMGVVGSLVGIVTGLALTFLIGLLQFGGYAFSYMPMASMLVYSGLSFVAGIFLCLVGAGYPALLAARMRPVEALRVEE